MYIVVEHEVTNPKMFWETAKSATANLPSGLKLHQVLPNSGGTRAVCLWEAPRVDEVRNYVEGTVGKASNNTYFAVEGQNAVGLPAGVKAGMAV